MGTAGGAPLRAAGIELLARFEPSHSPQLCQTRSCYTQRATLERAAACPNAQPSFTRLHATCADWPGSNSDGAPRAWLEA